MPVASAAAPASARAGFVNASKRMNYGGHEFNTLLAILSDDYDAVEACVNREQPSRARDESTGTNSTMVHGRLKLSSQPPSCLASSMQWRRGGACECCGAASLRMMRNISDAGVCYRFDAKRARLLKSERRNATDRSIP